MLTWQPYRLSNNARNSMSLLLVVHRAVGAWKSVLRGLHSKRWDGLETCTFKFGLTICS
ncbi:hypothetical protein HanRHA438_Chr11g0526521 [Helianthus annuus]|nr:hypothetical protein HanIR_Chr11g0553241 [Helianthus annuus]KAJ0691009.1 hypothetical protein HanOQP8_Chr11g0424311 [Helianthus annuus]KAJ0735923.1 hypothetical protein HanPI659440_Chr11g0437821 [Helianthus annuus]KAJ0872678.1 hypothetical protein HanRHA438_Chr11g0526521 [Helianthus annuus]